MQTKKRNLRKMRTVRGKKKKKEEKYSAVLLKSFVVYCVQDFEICNYAFFLILLRLLWNLN
jgi:hypothetical protein